MRVIATAPGRCGVLGNPTDMYGGSVLSCSLSERATAILESADVITLQADGGAVSQVIRTSDDLEPKGDRLDLAKAVLRGMNIAIPPAGQGFTLTTHTDIPMQAGLAGSTALMAAVYGALTAGQNLVKHSIAEAIRNIEYNQLGVICGFQDQYMAVFGGFNYIDFRDKGSHLAADTMPFATIEPLVDHLPGGTNDLPLVLANTGVAHHSGTAHKPVRLRWLDGDPDVVNAYTHLAALARHGKSALLNGDWATLASSMNENLQIQQRLGASGDACDRLAAAAMSGGALAAKLAGAGQGGTVLAVTFDKERTVKALLDAGATRILYPKPGPGLTITVGV